MSEEEIIEGNSLIHEFMGIPKSEQTGFEHPSNLLYNSSWDWLMPVWQKFRSLNWYGQDYCSSYSHTHRYFVFIISNKLVNTSIDDVFNELVEGIKWYNKINKL